MNKKTVLEYKGYIGIPDVSLDDDCLMGKVECINDLIIFEGNTVSELKADFEAAIDDYLELCSEVGKEPNKTMSGSFNVRIGPERHKQAHLKAIKENVSLNEVIKMAVDRLLIDPKEIHFHNHTHTVDDGSKIPVELWSEPSATDYQMKTARH